MEKEPAGLAEEPIGLTMAKWAVDRGALVIPAYIDKDCEKRPLIREWQNKGSRDYEQLERWWDERRWASCGVLGGRGAWLVFDCDGNDAVEFFRTLCLAVGGIDWSGALVYRTPGRKDMDGTGGGLHCMWRWPGGLADLHKAEIRQRGWRGGLELRGKATWTLLPCRRRDGVYEMLNEPEEMGEAPRELVDKFLAEAEQTPVGGGGSGDLKQVSPEEAWAMAPLYDNRKQTVAGIAWHQSIRGKEYDEVLEVCERFAVECCSPALDLGIVQRKVDYAWQRVERIKKERSEEESREMAHVKLWTSGRR